MNDKIYSSVICRRRSCKKIWWTVIAFLLCFYISFTLFNKGSFIMHLTDLHLCPSCYGVSVCPELYSNQFFLDTSQWVNIFNTKNVYYGYTAKYNRRVVLKKLASKWEFSKFDEQFCEQWGLKINCKPIELKDVKDIDKKIANTVKYNLTWPDQEARHGLVLCPYVNDIQHLIMPFINDNEERFTSLLNMWTMLNINPEPIILQMIPKSKGWPVPAYGGVCGRLEVVAYEGEPLSSRMHVHWYTKLKYAKQILNAALDFTFKHERYRFYLMDWSLDNIVVNENDKITFVDLEDIIVLDKDISPKADLPEWYQRYSRENLGSGFTFSIENICKSHLSDHNLWAACYVLAGSENPLLYPIPKEVLTSKPHLDQLLTMCLNGDDRFRTITKLQHVLEELIN